MRKFIWLSILLFFAPICAFGEVNCTSSSEEDCSSKPGCEYSYNIATQTYVCKACKKGYYSLPGDKTCSECTKPAIAEWLNGYTGMTQKDACPWQVLCGYSQQANCDQDDDGNWSCSCGDCYGGSFMCIFNNGTVDCDPTSVGTSYGQNSLYCTPSESIKIKLDYDQKELDDLNAQLDFVDAAFKVKDKDKDTSKNIVVYYKNMPVGDGAQWHWYYSDDGADNSNKIPTVAYIEGGTNDDNFISVADEIGDRLYIRDFIEAESNDTILGCLNGNCYFSITDQRSTGMTPAQLANKWLKDKLKECADAKKESCEITLTANWTGRPMKVWVPSCPSDDDTVEIKKNFMYSTTIKWADFYPGIANNPSCDISTLCSGVKTVGMEQYVNNNIRFDLTEDGDAYKIKIPPNKDDTVEFRSKSESCPAGEYCAPQNSVPCESTNCPKAFTSDGGASKIQDCYIDPDTEFKDSIGSIKGVGEEKFYYHGTGQ